ncbi:MAG: ribosome silencing factor [Desulfovibrionaceae bacterium]
MIKKKKQYSTLASIDKAKAVCAWLDAKQASDVLCLDVRGLTPVADMIVLATARTTRHAQALADELLERAGAEDFEYLGMEGYRDSQWVLVDLNDVVVHIFLADARRFYNLEGMWSEGADVPLELAGPVADSGDSEDDYGDEFGDDEFKDGEFGEDRI